ncbi:Maf family nucleotide pyrophosphatase [Rhodobacteraceae bacterium N5(2021)]|uniref:Nucleoside triphosphate pyrophosphatase n=1 Tax=Gymnodinialimonas phycosphaerae TaxID=2841589 RepID=A0A975TTJ6_9RHOB|nr:Maf family nucleotide pyrophosphatase [Gymnodinialimonas phycosphaerae]MBY4894268.1 Maf family nucleotide pyrophosphatase [Gymnodinialimonas phycosphaerae]
MSHLILASSSPIRRVMLQNAGIRFESSPVRIDEDAIRQSLVADQASPRDIADALAEFKARKAAEKWPTSLTLGSDQILALRGEVFAKPNDREDAAKHLRRLSGQTHHLYSAAVIYEDAKPVWRTVGSARLSMHTLTDSEIDVYLDQAWPEVSGCVGAYQAEALGAQLFSRIDGDWFSVLGLPLLQVLSYLRMRGMLVP